MAVEIWMLEADLQNLTVIADKPSCLRIRKTDRPVTAHLRKGEPRLSFVGSPSRRTGAEIRLSLGRYYDGPIVFMARMVFPIPVVRVVSLFKATGIGETEDRSWSGRLIRKLPCLAAIVGTCCLGTAVGRQITTAHDPVAGIPEATEKPPALALLTSGVSYAVQLSPPSRVAKIRAM